MDPDIQSRLAPPGAGLPAIERFIGDLLFRLRRRTTTRESSNTRFQKERAAIHALVISTPESNRGTRVLIQRPRGLEDSSRYWSIWMTLEHLRIVHCEMSRVITTLSSGQTPTGEASTATVKPCADVDADVVAAHERSCDELLAAVAASPNLKTHARFAHPWFGPLDAAGWHALAAGHMGIHRVQIKRIRAGLQLPD